MTIWDLEMCLLCLLGVYYMLLLLWGHFSESLGNYKIIIIVAFVGGFTDIQILYILALGMTTRRFVGHKKDVLSVAFSADNRQIVSASRDKTIKLWNTLGVCKFTIQASE